MYRLLESIYLRDGQFRNLSGHQARITHSAQVLFKRPLTWTLESVLGQADVPVTGLFKARLVYDQEVVQLEFIPYHRKPPASLKLVEIDFVYAHKFENRVDLNAAFEQRGTCDDVVLVRDGFVTDTSYANLIFKKGNNWYTPTTYLLPGTMRAHLLKNRDIAVTDIPVATLHQYESCKLINALLGMDAPEIPITSIR